MSYITPSDILILALDVDDDIGKLGLIKFICGISPNLHMLTYCASGIIKTKGSNVIVS